MNQAIGRVEEIPACARFPADWKPERVRGARVLVLGLGSFGGGSGAARFLAEAGAEVTVTDFAKPEALEASLAQLEGLPIRFVLGQNRLGDVAAADWIVASSAVPLKAPLLREAALRGIPVESEITLLFRMLPCKSVGITGTNGKSTTTRMVAHLLTRLGRRVRVGGNVGGSLLPEAASIGPDDLAVLELSSFQLEHLGPTGQGPDVAVVTNLTPDHLDRHGTMDDYAAAKRHILQRAGTAILNAEDPWCRQFSARFRGALRWVATSDFRPEEHPELAMGERAELDTNGQVRRIRGHGPEGSTDLREMVLLGRHNRLNLMQAALVAETFGAAFVDALQNGLDLPALPQRLTEIATIEGVRYVDDSVSTSPPAVIAAFTSLPRGILWLAGGYDKGIDPDPMLRLALLCCRRIYLYGAVAAPLSRRLAVLAQATDVRPSKKEVCQDDVEKPAWVVVDTLDHAFHQAAAEARSGDVVLLSPGFASYDQFRDFRQRGERFLHLVRGLSRAGFSKAWFSKARAADS